MNQFKTYFVLSFMLLATACGNPGDISDEFYNEYKQLGAPKILYSCTVERSDLFALLEDTAECIGDRNIECEDKDYTYDDVSVWYSSSRSNLANYNRLLSDAKDECKEEEGTFKVLESEK